MKKEVLIWLGELAIIHATGKETNGKYCLIELYATKEGSPPWHVHLNEDEGFYVIDGELTILVGENTYKAKKGDYLLAPQNIPHTYTVDSSGYARVLLICSPAGFEEAVRAMSIPATSLVPPKPDSVEIDYEKIMTLAKEYGVEFIEPPENR
ncbi:quercetin dioxygenase-like cupin family protein [Pontibacter aydingkolensis]|uniref:Cupin domain-containing protein n=1 Tax=Pontibacter aydingkolensis TaxID=1911536 RepID=A0ABS7CUT3_9BACT|nr:cupin domain-containing protein [Pontibacter aydingkolensis]MBW7467550.1 cupin domain-containing protein [Pontibacter aydingkolensis]